MSPKAKTTAARPASHMNSVTMVMWLRAMARNMPHGGKKIAAEKLGLSPSGLSKLLNNPERGFDEKTLNAVAWVELSKSSRFPEADFPVTHTVTDGPLIIETRTGKDGVEFYTWKPVKK